MAMMQFLSSLAVQLMKTLLLSPSLASKASHTINVPADFAGSSFPFGGVIEGNSTVLRGIPLRRETARETPETLSHILVAPTGFDHDASAFELEFEGLALAACSSVFSPLPERVCTPQKRRP